MLPARTISAEPNLVTQAGLQALELQLNQARQGYEAASIIEDVNERRRQAAIPLRDLRYFAERVRAQPSLCPTRCRRKELSSEARLASRETTGGCRNIESWERTRQIPKPDQFPTCLPWQGFSWVRLLEMS